jgi:hypothetical protein
LFVVIGSAESIRSRAVELIGFLAT